MKRCAPVLGAVLFRPNVLAQSQASGRKRTLKKGIMLSTVPGGGSLLEKFKRIKAAGFDGVEIRGSMERAEVMNAQQSAGLQIPTVCSAANWTQTLSDPNPSVRAEGVAALETALNDAKAYGGSSVLLVPAVVNERVSYADAYERSQAEIRKVIPLAEKLGIKIGIENVWNHFLLSPVEAVRYVDELKSAAVGWHFDVGNVIPYGWPEQWVRALGKRIVKLHIKEYSRAKQQQGGMRAGFQVDYLEGDNDWPSVMKALDEVGYHGWASAEPAFHPAGIEPDERLKQIAAKMDQIFEL